ncbi:hypothetical protein K469DRAFT_721292 [Zopfia rhizophila CBS 207.26]|uniref:Mid2 domain-containing protein n=1 Tax=Zopfia rhizophila CBS 207.26 TaxID=1314779 RepID=A0A6A6EGL3_9PEZI|nr:hypothetical protein K469DRAFT_721292 [Zopfia rhizophila CBS 207.26]
MARLVLSSFFLFAFGTYADYDKFFFTSEASNWRCPGLRFNCPAPWVCAYDGLLDKHYCCGTGSEDICWNGNTNCGGADKTPSTNQIGCSSGQNAFCCLKDREECTQRFNQINICWATAKNPFANFGEEKSNATFSSLSSANPSATTFAFDRAQLTVSSTSAASSSAATSSASISETSTGTSSTPTQTQSSNDSDSGISGGAIGGIVVGVVAGLALIGAGAFFLWRRQHNKSVGNKDGNPYMQGGYGTVGQGSPTDITKYAMHGVPVEMDASVNPVEIEGSKPHGTLRA